MSGKTSKLLRKFGKNKRLKQMYKGLDWQHRTKFNESLKLFIKTKNESSI